MQNAAAAAPSAVIFLFLPPGLGWSRPNAHLGHERVFKDLRNHLLTEALGSTLR